MKNGLLLLQQTVTYVFQNMDFVRQNPMLIMGVDKSEFVEEKKDAKLWFVNVVFLD